MMPYKRPAADKSGVPVYQPNATTYQQLMQLQQPFVPVSCEYSSSPTPTSASTSASPPSITTAEPQLVPATASQLSQIAPQQQKENEAAASRPASVPQPPAPALHDPAALAKEVAQQNYAKAMKLAAAANQQYAVASPLSHLNPLSYTGVALNKQTMSVPPPTFARYPTALPLGLGAGGLNFGLGNPYATAVAQSNFLNMTRGHPAATGAVINPYAIMRSPYGAAASQPLLTQGLLSAQYPVSVATTPITTVPPATITAAAVQNTNNNNNVTIPPYKKLKTT